MVARAELVPVPQAPGRGWRAGGDQRQWVLAVQRGPLAQGWHWGAGTTLKLPIVEPKVPPSRGAAGWKLPMRLKIKN